MCMITSRLILYPDFIYNERDFLNNTENNGGF